MGDDIQFVIDLGLCRLAADDGLVIANPIYREVLTRVLSFNTIIALPRVKTDGDDKRNNGEAGDFHV
jgi:hypothetical protein